MSYGYTYLAAGLASFSFLGIFAKIADLKRCRPTALYVVMCVSATLLSVAATVSSGQTFSYVPGIVIEIAIPFGALAALAGVAFQSGIRYGKLATSWLIINLSAAVPTIGSVLFYHEKMSTRHIVALSLMAISVVLLWKDKQDDERKAQTTTPALKENLCG
jgi:drug/metabolite transporter (DMT)-like permease